MEYSSLGAKTSHCTAICLLCPRQKASTRARHVLSSSCPLHRVFFSWSAYIQDRRIRNYCYALAEKNWRFSRMQASFRTWSSFVSQRKALRNREETLTGWMNLRVTQRAFLLWNLYRQSQRLQRSRILRNSLSSWGVYLIHRRSKHASQQVALKNAKESLQRRWFSRWKAETEDRIFKETLFIQKQSALRSAIEAGDRLLRERQTKMLILSFSAWREFVQSKLHKALLLEMATSFYARSLNCRTFEFWRDYTSENIQEEKHQLETASHYFTARRRLSILTSWNHWTQANLRRERTFFRVSQTIQNRKEQSLRKTSFVSWRQWLEKAKAIQEQADSRFCQKRDGLLQVASCSH